MYVTYHRKYVLAMSQGKKCALHKSPQCSSKLPQTLRRQMSKSWLAKFPNVRAEMSSDRSVCRGISTRTIYIWLPLTWVSRDATMIMLFNMNRMIVTIIYYSTINSCTNTITALV